MIRMRTSRTDRLPYRGRVVETGEERRAGMRRADYRKVLLDRYHEGKLITEKHNPDELETEPRERKRTVLSHESAKNFEAFVRSDKWDAVEYYDAIPPHNP
jgi:hypothetical protein